MFLLSNPFLFAQNLDTSYAGPEMATGFYADGKIYVVIGVIAIILVGIFIYLFRIDQKIKKIEKEIK